jgi:AhpD family alkylhydroperoxidase
MAVLAPLADADAPEAAQKVFHGIHSKLGAVVNFFRTLGHAPAILQTTVDWDRAIRTDLDPKLRELAYLKTSLLNRCEYCLHYHKAAGSKAGLTPEQIADLPRYEQSAAYDDLQKAVLRFADEWTRQGKASPAVLGQLSRSLNPTQLVMLAATCGLANWTNRFNETFAVELP